jgi:glycosyltransferase involved in cell wall biosynthesis
LPGIDPFAFLLKHADVRLFASRQLMTQSEHYGKSLLVPNGVDTQRFLALDRGASRRARGLPEGGIYIGYFGSMEPARGIDDLLAAVRSIRSAGTPIELLLAGRLRSDLDVSEPGVRYLGNVPFEQMPTLQASCDLIAVPYRRSAFMDAGASNKIAEGIASARPLVVTQTPNFVVNFPRQAEQLGGLIAAPSDPVDLARAILEQLSRRVLVDFPAGMDWPAIASGLAVDLALRPDPASYAPEQRES